MDPSIWKNPEQFDPDRYLQKDGVPKYANVPFGLGPKRCPGNFYLSILKT